LLDYNNIQQQLIKHNIMKKIFFIGAISTLLLSGLSSCYKTCEDPFAPNYTLEGSCIDLTAGIVGNYTGAFSDSIVGLHNSTNAITIQITKVDASHVAVASSGTAAFTGFTATVSSSSNGYYLTVPSQTATNGLAVAGAGTYFGNAADGVYTTAGRQLTIYTLAGTQYQGFIGIQ
jgi:hypothetical protein